MVMMVAAIEEDAWALPTHLYLPRLKACLRRKSRFLKNVQEASVVAHGIHAHISRYHLPFTGVLAHYLVVALAKSGALHHALHLSYYTLPCRTVFSWTAIISAYVEFGQAHEAFTVYQLMLQDCVDPNNYTFVSLLKACGFMGTEELEQGRQLHEHAHTLGFVSDIFVASSLVSMYGKCGNLQQAEILFVSAWSQSQGCPHDTVLVVWNAMLSAYVEQGQAQKALALYRRIMEDGTSPDQLTLLLAVKACAVLAEKGNGFIWEVSSTSNKLSPGLAIHMEAEVKGFTSDVALSNTLINMYGKCGALAEAGCVFCSLLERTVVSWRALLTAYVDQGDGEKALQLYLQMGAEGVEMFGELTLVLALQACILLAGEGGGLLNISYIVGQALHADVCKHGLTTSVLISTSLLTMYAKCGDIVELEHFFSGMSYCNVASWNAMLSAYIEKGDEWKALQLFVQMQEQSVKPNRRTYVLALQACVKLAEKEKSLHTEGRSMCLPILEIGQALHLDLEKNQFASDAFVGSTLLTMYGKCGALTEAENVFASISECSTIVWTAMLSVYIEEGQGYKVLQLFEKMQREQVLLNDVTLVCVLQACSATGSLELCRNLHFSIVSAGCDLNPALVTTLIHAYGNCASMADAQAFFDKILGYDVVSWNACISGHMEEGNFAACLHMFEKLKLAEVKPDKVTFTAILSVCCQAGLVAKGLEYFEQMSRDYGVEPELKHYGSMLGLLGHTGEFKRLESMLQSMPMQANLIIWSCLLKACCLHGNVALAKQAFNSATNMHSNNPGFTSLLS